MLNATATPIVPHVTPMQTANACTIVVSTIQRNRRWVWPQDLESIAEQQPEARTGDAAAISVSGENGQDTAVLLLQCRKPDQTKQSGLTLRIQKLIRRKIGIDCKIELVSRHTLPRTTSGKLARARARQEYLERMARTDKIVRFAKI